MVSFEGFLEVSLPWIIVFLIILIIWSRIQNQSLKETIEEMKEIILSFTTKEEMEPG